MSPLLWATLELIRLGVDPEILRAIVMPLYVVAHAIGTSEIFSLLPIPLAWYHPPGP